MNLIFNIVFSMLTIPPGDLTGNMRTKNTIFKFNYDDIVGKIDLRSMINPHTCCMLAVTNCLANGGHHFDAC